MKCGFSRRLAAMFYDSILLTAVLFTGTLLVLPLTHGEAVPGSNLLFKLYLYSICGLYFTWQWSHGGQTLGMLAWKIRLRGFDSDGVSGKKAVIRFLLATISLACLGAGFIWALFDPEKLAFHDRYSGTFLVIAKD
jgi:uncharacterized RDD family membrane protein YckC